jgi:hypothetical protein
MPKPKRNKLKFSKYFKREALGLILYPVTIACLVIAFHPLISIYFPEFNFTTTLFWALFSGVAGFIALLISYIQVYRKK